MKHGEVTLALEKVATSACAVSSARFFKMGEGEYGAGDEFIGVTVPEQRKVARQFATLPLAEVKKLLKSKKHEHRFTALLILVERYKGGDEVEKKAVVDFYLTHLDRVNNWDLVDTSAYQILGDYCVLKDASEPLYALVRESDMWKRRVGIVGTFAYIKKGKLEHTFMIAEQLLSDKEDLLHKATGWMLREAGKKNMAILKRFLKKHGTLIPRTTLRYAIEKFPEHERKVWLKSERKYAKKT